MKNWSSSSLLSSLSCSFTSFSTTSLLSQTHFQWLQQLSQYLYASCSISTAFSVVIYDPMWTVTVSFFRFRSLTGTPSACGLTRVRANMADGSLVPRPHLSTSVSDGYTIYKITELKYLISLDENSGVINSSWCKLHYALVILHFTHAHANCTRLPDLKGHSHEARCNVLSMCIRSELSGMCIGCASIAFTWHNR